MRRARLVRLGGTGLGLPIARRAVELHKGRLLARNANPGLLVEIELPAGNGPAMDVSSASRMAKDGNSG